MTRAAVVVLDFPSLELREQAIARQPTKFPYVPGYLSFREIPAVLAALKQLKLKPDLLLWTDRDWRIRGASGWRVTSAC